MMVLGRWRPDVVLSRPGFDGLTLTCVGLLVVQVVLGVSGGAAAHMEMYHDFGLSRPGLLEGRLWQVVTYAFLHGDWAHFVFNWLMIYLLGGKVRHILGDKGMLKVLFSGVLAGALFHVLFQPSRLVGLAGEPAHAPLVGASAGVMALLLVLTGLSPQSRFFPLPVRGRNLAWGVLLSAALLYLCTPTLGVPGFSQMGTWMVEQGFQEIFQVAHACHFGGGVAGCLFAKWLLRKPVTLADLQKERAKREGGMAA